MSLNIAKIANRIGFTNLASELTILRYGKPIGNVSKTGIRGYSFITDNNKKFAPHLIKILTF